MPRRLDVSVFAYLLEPRPAAAVNIARVLLSVDTVVLAHVVRLAFRWTGVIYVMRVGIGLPLPAQHIHLFNRRYFYTSG